MTRRLVPLIACGAALAAMLAAVASGPEVPASRSRSRSRRQPWRRRRPEADLSPVPHAGKPSAAELPAPPAPVPAVGTPAPACEQIPVHQFLADRKPDEVRPDGTHVYHGYPFQLRQPDGTYANIPVTVTFKTVPAVPIIPPELETAPGR